MAIKIVTDSASDMPEEIKGKYDIHVIPTPVTIEGVDHLDGETIFSDEFYRIQKEGRDIKTYHVSQYMFEEQLRPYAQRGEEVLYICFSTGIAGTYNAAVLAKEALQEEYPHFAMTIIDSHCVSGGMSLMVERLLTMQLNGAPREWLIRAAEFYSGGRIEHIFTVTTLEYLVKGGRVSRFSGVMGGALDIKPIIIINKDGALEPKEKVRGFRKAITRCIDLVGERSAFLADQVISICYGEDKKLALEVEQRLKDKYHIKEARFSRIGCAIGAHTGPGILGIVVVNDSEEEFSEYLN
jgi:DegV family protein with EDD domain